MYRRQERFSPKEALVKEEERDVEEGESSTEDEEGGSPETTSSDEEERAATEALIDRTGEPSCLNDEVQRRTLRVAAYTCVLPCRLAHGIILLLANPS